MTAANHFRMAVQTLSKLSPDGMDVLLQFELEYVLHSEIHRPTIAEIDAYASLLVMTTRGMGAEVADGN